MKTTIILASIAALLAAVPTVTAETPAQRDFNQLRASRDKALAVAADPINRRYKDELEKLFKKATQAADLDTAKAIQAELQAVGGSAAANAVAAKQGTTTSTNPLAEKADLKKFVSNSEWIIFAKSDGAGEPRGRASLLADGKCVWSDFDLGSHWLVENPDILKITKGDPKKNSKVVFRAYHINMEDKTAVPDSALSTFSPSGLLKYDGPAKAKGKK